MSARMDVPQLLERVAESFTANVLPHVTEHYARMQLNAVCELLANVGSRVEWRCADVPARAAVLCKAIDSPALQALRAEPAGCTAPADRAQVATLLEQLAAVIDALYVPVTSERTRDEALVEIWKVIRSEFAVEGARIRTGMFSNQHS